MKIYSERKNKSRVNGKKNKLKFRALKNRPKTPHKKRFNIEFLSSTLKYDQLDEECTFKPKILVKS